MPVLWTSAFALVTTRCDVWPCSVSAASAWQMYLKTSAAFAVTAGLFLLGSLVFEFVMLVKADGLLLNQRRQETVREWCCLVVVYDGQRVDPLVCNSLRISDLGRVKV